MQKTTPSQDMRIPWVAGIIEGEGTIELFKPKHDGWKKRIGITVTNTDIRILNGIQDFCDDYEISWVIYSRKKYTHKNSFSHHKECFGLHIRKHNSALRLSELIYPYIIGEKKEKIFELIEYLKSFQRRSKKYGKCEVCEKTFHRVYLKQRFCCQQCWRKYSTGKNNPNYKHGKYQV